MKNKLLYVLIAIIIIIGLIMGITMGFNYGINYGAHEKIEIYINQEVNTGDIKDIASEVFKGENTRIQTVELFKDMAAITVKSSTDEQIEKLVQIVNEKYGEELTVDDVTIVKIPQTSVNDIIKSYLIPVILIMVASSLYIAIRYWKLGFWKILLKTLCTILVVCALFVSAYTIIRIPVNEIAMPIGLFILVFTIFALQLHFNKKEEKAKLEEIEEE